MLVSKKPLDQLSSKQKTLLKNKLIKCGVRNRGYKDDFSAWFYRVLSKGFYLKPEELNTARNLRREYDDILQKVKLGSIAPEDLEYQIANVDNKFSPLFPSEVTFLKNELNNAKSKVANASVSQLLDELKNISENLDGLYALSDFRYKNPLFYSHATASNKGKVEDFRDSKMNLLIKKLMDNENARLNDLKSLNDIDIAIQEFKNKYNKYLNKELVSNELLKLKKFKTFLIEHKEKEILSIVEDSPTTKFLNEIKNFYLKDVVESNAAIKRIKEAIAFEENRIARAKAAKEKQRQLKLELVRNYRKQITLIRQDLSSKYGSYFPSLSDLRKFMKNYRKVVNNFEGQYNVSDGNQFVNAIEYYGYRRKGTGNLSDIESFVDKNGFTLKASSLDKTWDKKLEYVGITLEIDNASEDIFELYEKEFKANLRRTNNEIFDATEELQLDELYTVDGIYMFKISREKDNALHITIIDNENAQFPIIAEKIGDNKIKVTPWTSYAPIKLTKGRKIKLWTFDYIKLGVFSVNCYADGIQGFRWNNIEGASNFPHGSLLGKVGADASWMLVGKNKTFTSKTDGLLWLKINDAIPEDNRGEFVVNYEFIYD